MDVVMELISLIITQYGLWSQVHPQGSPRACSMTISGKYDYLYTVTLDNGEVCFESVHPLFEDFDIYLSDPNSLDKIRDKLKYIASRRNKDYDRGLKSYNSLSEALEAKNDLRTSN